MQTKSKKEILPKRLIVIPDLPNEIWKDIKDYEGLYQISNLGRVKYLGYSRANPNNKKHPFFKQSKIQSQHVSYYGYKAVMLAKNKKSIKFLVHRLLGTAFIPNPENKPQINHKDRNKINNDLSNLEWATGKENTNHAYDNGYVVSTRKLTQEQAEEIRRTFVKSEVGKRGNGSLLCKKFNVNIQIIRSIANGKSYVPRNINNNDK